MHPLIVPERLFPLNEATFTVAVSTKVIAHPNCVCVLYDIIYHLQTDEDKLSRCINTFASQVSNTFTRMFKCASKHLLLKNR